MAQDFLVPCASMQNPVQKAVAKVGTQKELARRLKPYDPKKKGLSQQAIQLWVKQGYVPPNWCAAVESITGVSRSDLNSRVFGKARAAA